MRTRSLILSVVFALVGGGLTLVVLSGHAPSGAPRNDETERVLVPVRAIAVGDTPRVGQTVQFHVRDADTAHEDLQLLLDAQQLKEAPLGAMLFTCNGRGARLFKDGRNDVQTIRDRLGDLPLAGFFAAGEIGPIGGRCFVHGHTAALALIRTAGA